MDQAVAAISEQIRAAASDRSPLRVRAGGSKDFYGNTPHGALLDPRAARGIVAYDPSELSIAVRCGTPLAQLEAALEERGQMLAFEPPHFGAHATIGGCIATGLAGPRRAANGYCYGGVRDFVLGAKLLDGQGQLLTCGGLVMKNVAGYDLARLLTGSMGVLGVLIEVALKVVPKPRMEATLRMPMDEATALAVIFLGALSSGVVGGQLGLADEPRAGDEVALADLRLGVATRDTEPAPVRIGRRGERRAQPLTWRGHPAERCGSILAGSQGAH